MPKVPKSPRRGAAGRSLGLARVLLVHGELAPRLALRTILEAGGYSVDIAGSVEEALGKLDRGTYALVLSDSDLGSRLAGRNLLAYARVKEYQPATALVTSYERLQPRSRGAASQISVRTENLPHLLAEVAELVGLRASRRYRPLHHAVPTSV